MSAYARVLGLDAEVSGLGARLGFGSAATTLVTVLLLVGAVAGRRHPQTCIAIALQELDIVRDDPAPRPQETGTGTQQNRLAPPARASKVLTSSHTVDLTASTFVQGPVDSYAGDLSSEDETGIAAVHVVPVDVESPVPVFRAPRVVVQALDRSRLASLAGSTEWSCPFPAEGEDVDDEFVTLQLDVSADGSPTMVRVLKDPGMGFGEQARRCALGRRYSAALDRDGEPVAGTTRPFRVHFMR